MNTNTYKLSAIIDKLHMYVAIAVSQASQAQLATLGQNTVASYTKSIQILLC